LASSCSVDQGPRCTGSRIKGDRGTRRTRGALTVRRRRARHRLALTHGTRGPGSACVIARSGLKRPGRAEGARTVGAGRGCRGLRLAGRAVVYGRTRAAINHIRVIRSRHTCGALAVCRRRAHHRLALAYRTRGPGGACVIARSGLKLPGRAGRARTVGAGCGCRGLRLASRAVAHRRARAAIVYIRVIRSRRARGALPVRRIRARHRLALAHEARGPGGAAIRRDHARTRGSFKLSRRACVARPVVRRVGGRARVEASSAGTIDRLARVAAVHT